jgi:hypothetical protein
MLGPRERVAYLESRQTAANVGRRLRVVVSRMVV